MVFAARAEFVLCLALCTAQPLCLVWLCAQHNRRARGGGGCDGGGVTAGGSLDKSNPMGYMILMQTVCQTSLFIRQAEKLFSTDDLAVVVSFLAANPQSGDIIPGTGGVRKVRVPVQGRGKRGGARVIYYWFDARAPLYALLV